MTTTDMCLQPEISIDSHNQNFRKNEIQNQADNILESIDDLFHNSNTHLSPVKRLGNRQRNDNISYDETTDIKEQEDNGRTGKSVITAKNVT